MGITVNTWECCRCGMSGMLKDTNPQCTEISCQHARCKNCIVHTDSVGPAKPFKWSYLEILWLLEAGYNWKFWRSYLPFGPNSPPLFPLCLIPYFCSLFLIFFSPGGGGEGRSHQHYIASSIHHFGFRLHTALQQNPKTSTTLEISARPQHILGRGLELVMLSWRWRHTIAGRCRFLLWLVNRTVDTCCFGIFYKNITKYNSMLSNF